MGDHAGARKEPYPLQKSSINYKRALPTAKELYLVMLLNNTPATPWVTTQVRQKSPINCKRALLAAKELYQLQKSPANFKRSLSNCKRALSRAKEPYHMQKYPAKEAY